MGFYELSVVPFVLIIVEGFTRKVPVKPSPEK